MGNCGGSREKYQDYLQITSVSGRRLAPSCNGVNFWLIVGPNADTVYSTARLDVSKEPLLLHVPDSGGLILRELRTCIFFDRRSKKIPSFRGGASRRRPDDRAFVNALLEAIPQKL